MNTVFPIAYDSARGFSDGLAVVSTKHANNKYGYIDKSGKMAIKGLFETANDFYYGGAVVGNLGKTFVIDKFGNIPIEPGYARIDHSKWTGAYYCYNTENKLLVVFNKEFKQIFPKKQSDK